MLMPIEPAAGSPSSYAPFAPAVIMVVFKLMIVLDCGGESHMRNFIAPPVPDKLDDVSFWGESG